MPGLDEIVRTLDSIGAAISIGGRTLLRADTNPVPREWDHVTKVDPEKTKQLPLLYPLYLAHTSAVSIGGSQNVTEQNTLETFDLVNAASVPGFHEPSEATHVTETVHDRAEFMAVPEVLNGDTDSIVGALGKSLEHGNEEIAPRLIRQKVPIPLGETIEDRVSNFVTSWLFNQAVFEAYIIMNVDSAAAREANVTESDLLSPREAKQHAMAAEHHLESEIIYLEYSGRFGGEEAVDLLEAISGAVSWPRIWYGGGLDNRENARSMLDAGADAVVVGDIFHQIAAEECDHCEAAAADLGTDADGAAVGAWVEDHVDVPGSSAAAFLSTVPDLPDPEQRAREYVAATIETYLGLRSVAETLGSPADTGGVERTLDDRGAVPGAEHVRPVLDDGTFHRRLAVSLLADEAGLLADLPVSHIGVDL